MKCPICDREDDLIAFNKVTGKFGDCVVCQAIVEETLEEFDWEDVDDF